RGLEIAEELEDRALCIEGHMRLGFLLFNLGELGEAEEELLRCSALAGELGSHRDEARVTFQLALVKYYRGELDEAERLGEQAFDGSNVPEEDVYARAALLLAEATIATASGEENAATASFGEALRLLEELQLVIDIAEARLAFARALRSFGEEASARTELERA